MYLRNWIQTAVSAVARWAALAPLCLLVALPMPAHAAGYSDMIVDANSGAVLHATNIDEPRFPASLAKMMTLYVVFDMIEKHRLSLDTNLIISAYDASAQPTKLGLKEGSSIVLSDAIKALVTASANDVARAIAENLAGDEEKFAKYMTWQAHKLGMKNTTFRNASGLPNSEQTTTARDYITLSLHLYDDFPQHFKFFKTAYFNYGRARYRNHNGLLFNFQGSDGIKTGYTRASGFNLAASVRRSGKHVIGVIFGGRSAGDRNQRMRGLLTAGLAKGSTVHTRIPAKPEPQVAAKAIAKPKTVAAIPVKATAKGALAALIVKTEPKVRAVAVAEPAPETAAPAELADSTPEINAPGPFHVQIGAYPSEDEARQKLGVALGSAKTALTGHTPVAIVYNASSKVWYRARFAGFERPAADQTCAALKTKHFECIVMRAD